jgi:hypothetical protein
VSRSALSGPKYVSYLLTGPIIDAAVPALNAVFSNDTKSEPAIVSNTTNAQPPQQDLEQRTALDFHALDASMQKNVQQFVADFKAAADESQRKVQAKLNALDGSTKEAVTNALRHQVYLDRQSELTNAM